MRRLTLVLPVLVTLLTLSVARAQLAPSDVPPDVQTAITQYAASQAYAYGGDCQIDTSVGDVCSLTTPQSDGSYLVNFSTIQDDGSYAQIDQLVLTVAPTASVTSIPVTAPPLVSVPVTVPAPTAPLCPNGFIPSAGNGRGPTLCRDGLCSHSAGPGTCSGHGGVAMKIGRRIEWAA